MSDWRFAIRAGETVMPNVGNHYIDETSIEARAAFSGRLVLYGLIFGTLGAMGVFAIIYLYLA
jgi:hypothetical protein